MIRYHKYSDYLKEKYGAKTYKLTINLPLSCPNRDGTLGTGGCAFCGEEVAEGEVSPREVRRQIEESKDYIAERYNAEKFIAYFQSFTNTYLPLSILEELVREAIRDEDVVEVALATRPDCINRRYLSHLKEIVASHGGNLSIELGLQTTNYHTLEAINRGHTLAEFIDAALMTGEMSVEVCAHVILNLPGDDRTDVIECAKFLSALGIDTVKLHALFIPKNSSFAEDYRRGELEITTMEEYVRRAVLFLEYLDPEMAIQRLVGKAPAEETLFVNWGHSWWKVHQAIEASLKSRDTRQGEKFDYLDGKALRRRSF